MTRDDLIRTLVDKHRNISYKMMGLSIKHLVKKLGVELSNGARVEIRGFGSFARRDRLPRTARNPKTGAKLLTEHTFAVHFKPGKELRERVNNANMEETICDN